MAASSNLTDRFITVWYGLIWLVLFAAVVYEFAQENALASAPPLEVFLLGLLVVFSILILRTATRLFACLAVTTLVVPFYLFETWLWLTAAPASGKIEYVTRLREQGLAAYPSVFPSGFLRLWRSAGGNSRSPIVIDGREILPLAGIPDVLTVYCQAKDRTMVTYRSDAFGFRNPTAAGRRATAEFALLGDSFVQGYCVSDPFTYAEQLSVLGPTANYGMNATSALTQLAIYREYVKDLEPHHVIWFFYEGNDLDEYIKEQSWPLLRAYLERAHFQDLIHLNHLISSAMQRFVDQRLESVEVGSLVEDINPGILKETIHFLLLRRARAVLRLTMGPTTDLTETEWREITGIWREVIEAQHVQGGQVTFVYIPTHRRFLGADPKKFQTLEQKVVRLWSDLGADYVTLTEPLEAAKNPLAYYADNDLHFNEEGYLLTAETILEHLHHSAGG